MIFLKVFLSVCTWLALCQGADILGVFNHPGASHTKLGQVLMKNLAKRGHQVTMISAFPLETPVENYTDIYLKELIDDLNKRQSMYFKMTKRYGHVVELRNMTAHHLDLTLSHPEVKELLHSNRTFDVIILDYFYNEALLFLGHVFKAPIILSSSFGNNFLMNKYTGNTLPISYVPGGGFPTSDNMSFFHRVMIFNYNVWFFDLLLIRIQYPQKYVLKKHNISNVPSRKELEENVALVLANSHFSVETVRPFTPNIIPIAGFHIAEKPEELPEDLKQFLDAATEGVVLFSLGTQIKSSTLNKSLLHNLLETFRRIPQKVLWKFEADHIENLPPNVKLSKWMPLYEVLCHPNTRLLVFHGGTLTFIEAVHCGVPMICIPLYGDQQSNAAFVESRKLGHRIVWDDIRGQFLYEMITNVTGNPEYRQAAQLYSSLLREQPIKPLDNAIFWVEHVIEHKGAPHLKPYSVKLPWYQYHLIDVIAFMSAVVLLLSVCIWLLTKKCFQLARYLLRCLLGRPLKEKTL